MTEEVPAIDGADMPPVEEKTTEEEQATADAPTSAFDFSTLRIGDRVHYVLNTGLNEGQCRPLDIANFADKEAGLVNGFVTTDANRDYTGAGHDGLFVEACAYDADHAPGTWHPMH